MQSISSTEASQTFIKVIEQAQREPVIIRDESSDIAVIMSIEDYKRLTQINIKEFQKFRKNIGKKAEERGLTEEHLNELLSEE